MVSKPDFIIVAGPNGAGKSTYCVDNSNSLLHEYGIGSFDLDIEFAMLYDSFSNIMNEELEFNLLEKAKDTFEADAHNALQNKTSFSFQTNFDKSYTDKWRKRFAQEGFNTHLIFLLVQDKETCYARVDKRVSEGGHFVPKTEISERYDNGLKILNKYHELYDTVKIIDTTDQTNVLLYKRNFGEVNYMHKDYAEIITRNNLDSFEK